jgi:ABC-type multidrug transport system fused ATPase/permease subunit
VNHNLEAINASRLVIAHRLTTIMQADRIYLFDNGRILQSGTYDELINQPGPFAELAKRQLAF